MENEQMLEQKKLDEFLQVINENLKELREKKKEVDQENKELYDAYMEGDVELYSFSYGQQYDAGSCESFHYSK